MDFRRKLQIELYCSKHPEQQLSLEVDKSTIGADSAYTLIPKISVNPCDECERELDKIKWSIRIMMNIKNEDAIKIIEDTNAKNS